MSTFELAEVPAGIVAARRAPAPGVVSFRASLPVATRPGTSDDLALALAVRLLDKGTPRHSRHDIAEWLDAHGASLSFSAGGDRVGVSGRSLREDLPRVLALAAEQLAEPLFDADEVDKARARLLAGVKSAEEDPGAHADGLLRRALFPPDHPGHARTFADTAAGIAALTQGDIRAVHALGLADASLTLALGGDVDGLDLYALAAPFGVRARSVPDPDVPAALPGGSARASSVVPGTSSADVRLGHALALRRGDADYLPLRVAIFALGGNFSSRLMQTVRDRDGLTYGIHARLEGIDARHEGHVEVDVTLSPDALERGIDVTRREIEAFVAEGLGGADVARVATTLGGQQRVGLSTSGGSAGAQLSALEQRLGADYPDRFAALVASVTADTATDALRRHLRPESLVTTLAGPVSEGVGAVAAS